MMSVAANMREFLPKTASISLRFPLLTDADLTQFAVLLGHRRRLLKAITELRSPRPSSKRRSRTSPRRGA